jgi:polyisoprenoid-binding protein YceI
MVLVSGYGYLIGCRHDDSLIVPIETTKPFVPTRGNNVHLPGSMTKGDSTQWKLDKVHSSTLWSAAYVGAAGLLTGRFNQFGMHNVTDPKSLYYPGPNTVQPLLDSSWAFNESDPTKTYFNGYVQINTSNTGEPGRDAGCNISGMGTEPIKKDTANLTIINLAKIKSTKVELDPASNDYIVTLDLTWQGKLTTGQHTESIVGKLKYIPKAYVGTGVYPAQYAVFGLQLTFQFNCRDYGITSTSIGDKIDIECNMNFNNK